MNSETFKKARLEVLDGKKPKACLRCYSEEDKGINSKRRHSCWVSYPVETLLHGTQSGENRSLWVREELKGKAWRPVNQP